MADPEQTIVGWSDAQLAFWRSAPPSRRKLRPAFDALNDQVNHIFLFDFAEGEVRIRPKPHYGADETQTRAHPLVSRACQYRDFFGLVARACGLRAGGTLAMTMEDYVHRTFDVPVFGFQKKHGSHQVLVPDIDAVRSGFYASVPDDPLAYDDKRIAAVFAGSTSGEYHSVESIAARSCQRLRSGLFFRDVAEVEFRLPKIVHCLSPEAEQTIRALGFGVGLMDWREHLNYRFLLSMDGNGATCSRVALGLKSNSVLVKYGSPFALYYFPGLIAGQHFLQVDDDPDVLALIERERDQPGLYRSVAAQGRQFFDTFLSAQASIAYAGHILRGYFELFGDRSAAAAPDIAGLIATAHVSNHGDITGDAAAWVGVAGQRIEGFSLIPYGSTTTVPIEYRGVVAGTDDPCWSKAGSFVGTRGQALPLFGFAVRLPKDVAQDFTCLYEGDFGGGESVGPVRDGAACRSATGAPLQALRVTIRKR